MRVAGVAQTIRWIERSQGHLRAGESGRTFRRSSDVVFRCLLRRTYKHRVNPEYNGEKGATDLVP